MNIVRIYVSALRERERALRDCQQAVRQLLRSRAKAATAYAAHPLPALAGAGAVGFVCGRMHAGSRVIKTAARIAMGPGKSVLHRLMRYALDA